MPASAAQAKTFRDRPLTRLLIASVLVIVGVVGTLILGDAAIIGGGWKSPGSVARGRATEQSLKTIESALKAYKTDKGVFPANLQVLVAAKLMDDKFKDAWRQDLQYRVPGDNDRAYLLKSAGPDGQFGTDDDIDLWHIDHSE